MSITIPVTLTVAPARRKRTSTTCLVRLSFSVQTNSSTGPPSQDIQIRNGGSWIPRLDLRKEHLRWWQLVNGNYIKWHFSIDGKRQCSASKSARSKVYIPGTFVGQSDAFQTAGGSVTDSSERCVGDNVFRQVNGISFTKVFGAANPLPQTLHCRVWRAPALSFNFQPHLFDSHGGKLAHRIDKRCNSG